ncbi:pancreatic lipase-related protein 2-like [Homalodisca vitripennis]|uniref:pancreatic lipase-related protein 2-like n=1 Tax=Homalodisca vitripennis TaxID=197043 RepID=UPI001EEBB459|nr:pancreatic lipase-related protein 2-like [Homalodisca vitripennis]
MSRGPAIVLAMTVGLCHCVVLDLGRNNRLEVNLPWLPFEGETRCYDELGCLNITRDWYHLIYRPFNVFPLPREVIDTRFVLYTRKNPVEGQTLKAGVDRTIQKSNFDAKKQTKLIVHGFIDTPLSNWVKEMRRELLKHSDWNVVVVDWAGGSLPLYTQATANTRLVGLEIAYFINYLSVSMNTKILLYSVLRNVTPCLLNALARAHKSDCPVNHQTVQ